jgi:hypothetical protein
MGARPEAASDRVRTEWLRRVEAEYRSAALTHHLTHWLIQLAAPPELIEDGLRIVGDELKHAELSDAVYREAGGRDAPKIVRESLVLPQAQTTPLDESVLRYGVEIFCLGETVAVRLFNRLRRGCQVRTARRALDRILRDEVRHRDFGWTLLEWLLESPRGPALRERLGRDLPGMLAGVRKNYGSSGARDDFHETDRAWGLMPLSEYAAAVEETFARDYTPLFNNLGVSV